MWILLAILVAGTLLINMGAISFMITLLAWAFKLALAVIIALAGLLLWRWRR